MRIIKNAAFFLTVSILIASCAKNTSVSNDDLEADYLKAYVEVNYPEGERPIPLASGLYIIHKNWLLSGAMPKYANIVYANYTSRSMDETITNTNSDSLATMIGTHSTRTYYGPRIFPLGYGMTMVGLEEAFYSLKKGESARILMPSKLSHYEGSSGRLLTTATIYDLELLHIIPDINEFQSDSLKAYGRTHFSDFTPRVDSLKTDLYYKTITMGSGYPAQEEDTMIVRYVGSLLDGFVFDTNIKDSAIFYYGKDFDRTASFDSLVIVMPKPENITTLNYVEGFSRALEKMAEGEEGVVFFSSKYGYGTQTSGQIPMFSMLRFYIKVERIGRKKLE
jgi:FKBP-type peptidyl-prolyl cis-trans isomerase